MAKASVRVSVQNQFLFTLLHLFREAWLQKAVAFGSDVSLMKFGAVIRLLDRDQEENEDSSFLAAGVVAAVSC